MVPETFRNSLVYLDRPLISLFHKITLLFARKGCCNCQISLVNTNQLRCFPADIIMYKSQKPDSLETQTPSRENISSSLLRSHSALTERPHGGMSGLTSLSLLETDSPLSSLSSYIHLSLCLALSLLRSHIRTHRHTRCTRTRAHAYTMLSLSEHFMFPKR